MEALVETATASLTRERSSWKALEEHHQKVSKLHLRTLFAEDPKRGELTALDAVTAIRPQEYLHWNLGASFHIGGGRPYGLDGRYPARGQ